MLQTRKSCLVTGATALTRATSTAKMSASATDAANNGSTGDYALRPRSRKPLHSKVSNLSQTSTDGDGLQVPEKTASAASRYASSLPRFPKLPILIINQRHINARQRKRASVCQIHLVRPQTCTRRRETPHLSHGRVCLARIPLRPGERLPRLSRLLQSLLDRAGHHGHHDDAAQHEGYRIPVHL